MLVAAEATRRIEVADESTTEVYKGEWAFLIEADCALSPLATGNELLGDDVWLIDTGRTCIEEGTATITLGVANSGVLQVTPEEGDKVTTSVEEVTIEADTVSKRLPVTIEFVPVG